MRWFLSLIAMLPLVCGGAASFNGSSDGASTGSALSTIGTNLLTLSYRCNYISTNIALVMELSADWSTAAPATFTAVIGSVSGFENWGIHGSSSAGSYHEKRLNSVIQTNVWMHRTVVLDRQSSSTNNILVYTNGIAAGLVQIASNGNGNGTTAFSTSHRLFIGGRNNGAAFRVTGFLQDVAIFAGQVSAQEALAMASGMSPERVRSARLINYWPLTSGENPSNSPDLVGGVPINSGTKSIVLDQAPTYRK